jgi:hypothetical protein
VTSPYALRKGAVSRANLVDVQAARGDAASDIEGFECRRTSGVGEAAA